MAYAVPTRRYAGMAYLLVWQGCCILLCCVCTSVCCAVVYVLLYVYVCVLYLCVRVALCPFMFNFCCVFHFFW